jgi:cation diffusion facilitator family transporter
VATDRLQRSLRATFLGLAANVLLTTAKLLAGLAGHSHALVADAVESLADVVSSIIVWRALVVAAEPPDEEHPYGHGKAEPIAAVVISGTLLIAAVWIVANAARQIPQARVPPEPFTLLVLLAVVVVKEGLFRFVLRQSAAVESSAVKADAWHHRSDAVTSLGAAIGISVALVGGAKYAAADDIAAIAAAGVIAWNGWHILRPSLNELMDIAPRRELVDRIRSVAEAVPGVARIEKCKARKSGYELYVEMHVEVDPQMTVQRAHEISHAVKDNVRNEIPRVRDVLVHIEPAK